MDITLIKKPLLNRFLVPISKFTDQCTIIVTNDDISSVAYQTTDKQTVILYAKLKIKCSENITNELKLNIGSIKKLMSAINCTNEDIITLNIDNNSINYTSKSSKFRFHLKEDGLLEKSVFNVKRLDTTVFDLQFDITNEKISELLKACVFSEDSDKLYITAKDSNIICEFTDKTIQNIDSMSMILAESYTGIALDESTILKTDIFKILSTLKFNKCIFKTNKQGLVLFDIIDDDSVLKYIATGLIK